MVSQWIRLIESNYFEITMPTITLDFRIVTVIGEVKTLTILAKSSMW